MAIVPAAFADLWAIRSYLEIMGQYSLIFNAEDAMSVPADGNIYRPVFTPSLDFNGVFMFGGDDGIFALYVKKDHVDLQQKNTVYFSAAQDTFVSVDEKWGMHYLGLGGRKYFFIDGWKAMQLLPYAAIDLGGYFTSNTVSKVVLKERNGSTIASGDMEANGGFFGVNVEAGADFWIMSEFAAVAKIGYRFCGGTVRSKNISGTPFTGGLADVYDVPVDYSGFYIQMGVTLNFQRYD